MISELLTLVAGHFVADYPLQGDNIATGKNRTIDPAKFGVPWWYWMAGHAATHALMVGVLTSSVAAGVFEFITHFAIDTSKCEKKINLHTDQLLHVFCKAVIVIVWC